jgi:hypothetical protein
MEDLVTYNQVMNKWNSGVLPQVADKADFLIVHSYYTPYIQNSNISTILNSAANIKKLQKLRFKRFENLQEKRQLTCNIN